MPSTISEPPPAYTSSPPLYHSHTSYHRLPKDDIMYDPITGERFRGDRYGLAARSQRANRRKMWCCFVVVIIIIMIALVIAGVVYHFGRTDNSNDSNFNNDCYPSEFNGYECGD